MNTSRLLIVDDEPNVLILLKAMLSDAGYAVHTAKDAYEAMALIESQPFDLLLLDLKLPGPSGLSLAERAHELQESCAVIMLSANPTRENVIEAVRASVDDFLLKPISNDQIRQAVGRAILKRKTRRKAASAPTISELVIGPLRIHLENRSAFWHDQPLTLTATEFCLLLTLAQQAGQSVSPSTLVRRCRGYAANDDEARLLLKPHIANLRQKLEQNGRFQRILINHRGVGFMLNLDDLPA